MIEIKTGKRIQLDVQHYEDVPSSKVHEILPPEKEWASLESIKKDKELMLELCNCDRFEDVHLEGCKYLKFIERLKRKNNNR